MPGNFSNMNSIFHKGVYRLLLMAVNAVGSLSLSRGSRLGALIGRLLFSVDVTRKRVVMENLSLSFAGKMSPEEIEETAGRVFENLGRVFFEVCWAWRLDPENWPEFFRIEGREHMEAALGKGRGVLSLTAHFGNWELLTIAGFILGVNLGIVYRPLDFPPLDRLIIDLRTRLGAEVIPRERSLRRLLSLLRRNGTAALLMDQNVDWYEGVFVDFFGRPACTSKGMALLALKSGAPVVPVFMVREKDGFVVRFLPEIQPVATGDRTKDIEDSTQRYTKAIEDMVRQYPEQWFWVHRRWKTRPYQPWPRRLC